MIVSQQSALSATRSYGSLASARWSPTATIFQTEHLCVLLPMDPAWEQA